MKRRILIVDDEPDMLQLLKRSLEPDLKCRVLTAGSGREALELLSADGADLVLADIKMPGMDGLTLLARIRERRPELTVLMMTAYGSIDTAVEAMKQGAYDFITKPFDHDALVVRLEKALERSSLLKENRRLKKECDMDGGLRNMAGKSAAMQRAFETIRMVAKTDLTVLITGESGTGKDLAARAVHALSDRSARPFIAVNCPAVPETILESELFGYKKGAFTHAVRNRTGLFQEADGGAVFLDEIGDISTTIQTKLLRVLQEKEFKPLGDNRTVKADVRIIASTNRDLKEKIRTGEFREDFYYRLNVLPVELPPLRERREDIPLIAGHLLEKHCMKLNKPPKRIAPDLMEMFMSRPWEGNVRELENAVIRGVLFSKTDEICIRDMGWRTDDTADPCPAPPMADELTGLSYKSAKEETLKQFNAGYLGRILSEHQGNVTRAAKQCGLERQSLQQIMKRYAINPDDYRQ